MLSNSVIKNVGQASHYYHQADNYYTSEQGIEQSEWFGRGAVKLELTGEVHPEQFTSLLKGQLPNGELLGKVVDGQVKHRAGWDLTFSAPKSVSIMALEGGDKRLIDAHCNAVKAALSIVEKSCSQARVKTSDGVRYENTHNIVAALYHHDLSREQDPQLHTHSVVMNMTERRDGQWRSQASQIGRYDQSATNDVNGFIERVRYSNRYFSKIYEAELAYRVKELGYEITTDTKSGIFEIAGVPEPVMQFFSKRREAIVKQLAEKGLSGGKASEMATLNTRVEKKSIDHAELKKQWVKETHALGFNSHQLIEQSQQIKKSPPIATETIDIRAMEVITQAAKDCSVFQTTFQLEDVITLGCEYAIRDDLKVESLLAAVESQMKSGDLIPLSNDRGKTELMAKASLNEEKNLFSQLTSLTLKNPTIDVSDMNHYLMRDHSLSTLSSEATSQLKTIFGSDRIVLMEGKSTEDSLLQPLLKVTRNARLNVTLLSPTLASRKQLINEVKNNMNLWEKVKSVLTNTVPDHQSVMQFLSETTDAVVSKRNIPDVMLVERTELLSVHQMSRLFEISEKNQTKLILLGNQSTLLSQPRGILLNELTKHHVRTISIKAKDETLLKAVEEKNIINVVNQLKGRVLEVAHADDRHHAMVNQYSKLDNDIRKESWLVAHHKQTVAALNVLTHESLLKAGQLKKPQRVSLLVPVFLAEGKRVLAGSYQKDQIIRFNDNYERLGVKRGDYLRVISHHKGSNRVVIQNEQGTKIAWQPDKIAGHKIELFKEERREIAENETLILHRSLPSKGLVKGERLTVVEMNHHQIKLKNNEGKTKTLDLSENSHRHFDYGYAAALHHIVHEKPAVIIAELATREFQTDQRRFFQAVSQPKEAWIYTDNHAGFVQHLENKTGNRLTAHETISLAQELKKDLHSIYDVLEQTLSAHCPEQSKPVLSKKAIQAVEYAIHHLSEREAGFTHKELMQSAIQQALGEITPKTVEETMLAMEKAGLLQRGQYKNDGTLWTTADAVKIEREIIRLCEQDKGKLAPIVTDALLEKHCNSNQLKPEQIEAVKAITQSRDRVMAIQGHPGTGKTTMLVTVADVLAAKNLITAEGYQLRGLAPTHTAVDELTKRGIPAETLDSFIINAKQMLKDNLSVTKQDKTILIIDETSMVSNRKMLEVLQIAHQLEYRGEILTGDRRQLASIEAGKPFTLAQRHVKTQELVDIRRQSDDAPHLKQAVKETIAYDFKAAFNTLKNCIVEVPASFEDKSLSKSEIRMANRLERVNMLVNDYFSFAKEQREHIQIITPGHDDRALVNHLIRTGLKAEGSLSNDKVQAVSILTSKNLTQVERANTSSLVIGDVLRFGKCESAQIKSGDYYSIVDVNKAHSILTLKSENGREIVWQVPTFDKKRLSSIEVFQKETREIQVGDLIRWSRSDKKNALLSTETARVLMVEKNKVSVELANKQVLTFDPHQNSFQHWDHGYAATVYAVQGKTKDIVLAHLESFRDRLTTQPGFLVALTRSVNTFRLYTDNKEKLIKTIEKNAGVKLSALEILGELKPSDDKNKAIVVSGINQPIKAIDDSAEKVHSAVDKINAKIDLSTQTKPQLSPDGAPKSTLADVITTSLKRQNRDNTLYRLDRTTVAQIKENLNQDAEKIAVHFLGEPKVRGGHYLKFGRQQGSLTVTIRGERQGWFNDFESNQGGRDMLKFIQVHGGMDRREALKYAVSWLGIVPAIHKETHQPHSNVMNSSLQKAPNALSSYQKGRMALANKIAKESVPIAGTLAEKYLKEHRGIALDRMFDDIRFHPDVYSGKNQKSLPALIAIARNKEGIIQAVEAIYLDKNTAKKADVLLTKQTIGSKKGAVVLINQADQTAPTVIAEGVVTGLSLAKALPNVNVRITLGKQMLAHIDTATLSPKVVFALDNDGKNLKTDKLILGAANRLITDKKDVSFMLPARLNSPKQDYNDVIKHIGVQAIQYDFKSAIVYKDFYQSASSPILLPEKMARLSKEIIKNVSQSNLLNKAEIKVHESVMQRGNQSVRHDNQSIPIEKMPSKNRVVEQEI